jgi:AcrR family transcriptional regulator
MVNAVKQDEFTPAEFIEESLSLFIPPKESDFRAFHTITQAKQQTIIDAALKEFATKGYRLASTNKIVKDARISKGILFRYFGNKENLYLYLINYVAEIVIREVSANADFDTTDIIDLMMRTAQAKVDTAVRHPIEMKLYRDMFLQELPECATKFTQQVVAVGYKMIGELLMMTNDALLKDGLDKEEVMSVVSWVLQGLSDEIIKSTEIGNTPEEYERYLARVNRYMDLMKTLFYR